MIYKDFDELNQTDLEIVQQLIKNKYAAVYEQSTLELDPSVDYEQALRHLGALETAIAAKRKALDDGGHFSIKDQLVSQGIVEWDEAEGAKWSTEEVQTSDHLTRKLRQLEGVELESSGYETAQRELKQLKGEFNKQLTYKDVQLHLEQSADLWETYPALTLLSKSGELQELQELELVKTKSSSGASVAAARPHQDVLSVPKQDTGHIEAIIHKTYEQQPELMGVIQNQATSIIHPSGDEAVQIYKGPGHTVEYTAQDLRTRRKNIFLVGQHQEDGRNIWVEIDTGSKAAGGKPSKLAVTDSPKESKGQAAKPAAKPATQTQEQSQTAKQAKAPERPQDQAIPDERYRLIPAVEEPLQPAVPHRGASPPEPKEVAAQPQPQLIPSEADSINTKLKELDELKSELKRQNEEKLELLLQKQEPTPQDLQWIREELQTQELQNKVEQLELLQQKNKLLLRQAQGRDATLNAAELETLDTQIQEAKQEIISLHQQKPKPMEQQWIKQEIEAQEKLEKLKKQREQLLYPDPFYAQMMKKLIEQDDELKRIQDMEELLLHKPEALTSQEQEWIKETFERLLVPREKQRIIRKLQGDIHELEAQKNKLSAQWSKTFDQREELYVESLHLSSQSQLSVLDAQWSKLYAESLHLSAQLSEADAQWSNLYAKRSCFLSGKKIII